MKNIRLLLGIIIMVGLTACEKEIPFSEIAPEPLMVVNGIQHVGEPARLYVEKTSLYTDNVEADFRVKDVHADLYVNGVFKESLQVRDSIVYQEVFYYNVDTPVQEMQLAFVYCEGTYILCEGDELRFEVSSSEFEKTAVAETKMPYTPNVVSFDTIRIDRNADEYDRMTIYFSLVIDDAAGKDYYNLFPKEGLDGFSSTDPVFADFMNIQHVDDLFGGGDYYARGPYNLFNDSYFDGNRYTLALNTNIYSEVFYEPFVLEVSKVDYGLYQFKKSYSSFVTIEDGPIGLFTEPSQVYSNVKNGVGVVCGQSQPVIMTIDLTEHQ